MGRKVTASQESKDQKEEGVHSQQTASALSGHQSAKLLGILLTWSNGVEKYISVNKSSQNAMHCLLIWSQARESRCIRAAREADRASARSMRRCARELLRVLTSTLPSSARCIQREAGLRRAPKWSVT